MQRWDLRPEHVLIGEELVCPIAKPLTLQKYRHDLLSLGKLGVGIPSKGPNLVPLGITPVLQTPSV